MAAELRLLWVAPYTRVVHDGRAWEAGDCLLASEQDEIPADVLAHWLAVGYVTDVSPR